MADESEVVAEVKALIAEMIDAAQRNKVKKSISERIVRGRAPSLSYEFEEGFARLLAVALPQRYKILIDYPMSYEVEGKGRKKTSYPDIAIVRDSKVLTGIIELKIDLGYLREGWVESSASSLSDLRNATEVTFKTDVGRTAGEKVKVTVDPDLQRAIVLLTGINDHGRLPGFVVQPNCFVLSSNVHPNGPEITESNRAQFLDKIHSDVTNQETWRKFARFLISHFP